MPANRLAFLVLLICLPGLAHFTANGQSLPFTTSPDASKELDFAQARKSTGGSSDPLSITITNKGSKPLQIGPVFSKFYSVEPPAGFDGNIPSGQSTLVKVHYQPQSGGIEHFVIDFFITDGTTSDHIKFPSVGGGILNDPAINITTKPLDPFPATTAASEVQTVTLTNNDKENDVALTAPAADPKSHFSVDFAGNSTCTLPHGGHVDAIVHYTPGDSPEDAVPLVIQAKSGVTSGTVTLTVSGKGKLATDSGHFKTAPRVGDTQILLADTTKGTKYEVWVNSPRSYWIGKATATADGDLIVPLSAHRLETGQFIALYTSASDSVVLDHLLVADMQQFHARVIGGYQQGGASGADSSSRFFFDTAVEYQIKQSRFHVIGGARIGSGAQDASAILGDYVAGLAGTVKDLTLNKIASVGEGWAGFQVDLLPQGADPKEVMLSTFAMYGINGYLQAAELNQTFAFPANTTQAYALLVEAQENSKNQSTPPTTITDTCVVGPSPAIPGVADNCQFVRFHMSQPHFYQEAYLGLKVEGYRALWGTPSTHSSKASLSAAWGFNEIVGKYRRPSTVRLEGFLPLSLPGLLGSGDNKTDLPIYLFGTAEINYKRNGLTSTPDNFIGLDDISTVKTTDGIVLSPSAINTFTITSTRQTRDLYSIGVGIDLISAYHFIFKL